MEMERLDDALGDRTARAACSIAGKALRATPRALPLTKNTQLHTSDRLQPPQMPPKRATGSARASGDVPVFTDFHWKKRKMKIDCGTLKFFFTPCGTTLRPALDFKRSNSVLFKVPVERIIWVHTTYNLT